MTTTNQVTTSFQSASKRMIADVRANLKSLDVAETQAHTKAMAAVDALPEVKRIILPRSQYLTQGLGKKKVIIDGPFTLRAGAHSALRAYVRKNPDVNPLSIAVCLGIVLRRHSTPFSPDYTPRGVAGSQVVRKIRVKAVNPERVKAQQELVRKRRLLSRANSSVLHATLPLNGKLYVVNDKTSLIVSGPYGTHSAAKLATAANTDLIVLSGQQCASAHMQYSPKFEVTSPVKLNSRFFAEGQTVLVNGKQTKITAIAAKKVTTKTITVNDESFDHSDFTLNYARRLLVLSVKFK